ncbi:MAG: RluA family pseudouridine synthase [Patescibacteria group bacterium]|nr:RluA family pseudouridine synthase [Patescibacteria group bacterium]
MKKNKTILVTSESAGGRLDVFLSEKLKTSRSQIQKMIDNNQIEINGRVPKKYGEIVKERNEIAVKHTKSTRGKHLSTDEEGKSEIRNQKIENIVADPKIIAVTPDYIIVNKPSGLLTHQTQAEEKNTLAGWLAKKYPEIKKVGDDPARPGIVHRLDKEASGLLVVARTQKMFDHLKKQFKNRTINKEYHVLVHGQVAKDWSEINFPISRSATADKMAASPEKVRGLKSDIGKEAKTEFSVAKRFVNFTLLKVKIHTGRMHQIRAHMLAYNHPVVGDPLYFQKKQKRAWDKKCGRLFLHSAKLGFKNLDGEEAEYESPLPKSLSSFLKQLK